jgi:hypothetical protein
MGGCCSGVKGDGDDASLAQYDQAIASFTNTLTPYTIMFGYSVNITSNETEHALLKVEPLPCMYIYMHDVEMTCTISLDGMITCST